MGMTETRADIVFTGAYWTAGLSGPVEGAVAVRGDTIVAVEQSPERVQQLTRTASNVVPIGDGILIPGFQDAHVHPITAGLRLAECALHTFDTAEEFLAEIEAYAQAHPDREWITGGGWSFAAFPDGGPRREALDPITGDRPAALVVRDEHAVWVNSEALRRAGITASTPDPAGGRIERDLDGEPTGVLHESAMGLLAGVKPAPTVAELDAALAVAQRVLHSHGVTAWQDALVGDFAGIPDTFDTYRRAANDGRLTARVNAALFFAPERGSGQIPQMIARRDAAGGRFTAHTVKIVQDGIPENHTAAMHAPYFDGAGRVSDISGEPLIESAALREIVRALEDAEFDIHFHTMGDRALSEVLDALEAASDRAGGARHEIAHLQSVRPQDVARFAPLGVTANMQAFWATHGEQMDHVCIPLLGAERADQQFPFADLVHADARLASGSDWPVSDPSPINAIHVAVNRVPPGSGADEPVFIERQRISLVQAMTANTVGSAFVNRLDDTGIIEPGMKADLAILDGDPFRVAPLDLHTITPIATYVGGFEVWSAENPR